MIFLLLEFELMHVDEFIDELLHSERVCDIILPRLQVRDQSLIYESLPPTSTPQISSLHVSVKHSSLEVRVKQII